MLFAFIEVQMAMLIAMDTLTLLDLNRRFHLKIDLLLS